MSLQSDIARKFVLPERQSKLATMLREEGLRDEQVYCLCRSTDVSRFMIGCDRCEEWYHGNCINVTELEASKIRKFYCQKCRQKNSGLSIKYKTTKSHNDKQDTSHQSDKRHGHHKKSDKKSSRCGECEACYIREDCGRCEQCKDKPKFGGPGTLGQKCKKRQCINFYRLAKKNKDHGRADHTYMSSSSHSSSKKAVVVTPLPNEYKDSPRPVTPPTCKFREKSPVPRVQIDQFKVASRPKVLQEPQRRKKVYEDDSDWIPVVLRSRNSDDDVGEPKPKKILHKETKIPKKTESRPGRKKKTRHMPSSDSDEAPCAVDIRPRQCFGPQCTHSSKPGSKYCSDECGLKLAEARIYSVLPQRIQEWHMRPCVSTERDRKKLEKLREQQLQATKELRHLDTKHKELDSFLEKVKAMPPITEGEAEEEESDYAVVCCVTCGHEVASKKALKHMHHCYNKLESQMSFGSMFKTRIDGRNMFCDFYNPVTLTYCRRLRVMCPEHLKDPKVSSNEVCGFPLVEDIFKETNQVCRLAKRMCSRHYLWEKIRRATIDMERVRQCLKLDELVEQERTTRSAMTNRAGVLGLMLHSTYNHPLLDKLQKQCQFTQGQMKHNQCQEVRESRNEIGGRQPPQKKIRHNSPPQQSKLTSQKPTLPVVQVNAQKSGAVKILHPEQKSDHPYHRHPFHPDKPKPRIVKGPNVKGTQKYVVDQGFFVGGSKPRTHDHLYSSSNTPVDVKRHQDHLYHTSKRP